MRAGSLFAGIGGFDLGFEWAGIETVWQVEKDEFCQKVLAKHWPNAKRHGDIHDFVKEIKNNQVEPVDIVAGGFPCQPFSQAGRRKGLEDDRYLWPAMVEVVSLLKPSWVIGENVPGIINMGFGDIMLSELESQGYRTESFIIPACAVGAPHRRDRVWIVAQNKGVEESSCFKQKEQDFAQGSDSQDKATEAINKLNRWNEPWIDVAMRFCHSKIEDPSRRSRLKALGNAVVPQIPYLIGKHIVEIEKNRVKYLQ